MYVSYEGIILALKYSNKRIIAFVFFLTVLNIYFQYKKWKVVFYSLIGVTERKKILLSLFYGFSGGIATPIRIGEYFGRKLPFENTSLMKITIATIVEKFASLVLVILIGSVTFLMFLYQYYSVPFLVPVGIITVFALLIIMMFYFKNTNSLKRILHKLIHRFKFVHNLVTELKYVKELGQRGLIKLIIYSLLFYFTYILQYALLVISI